MTRSDPGGLARSDSSRASTYRAALQQFEELIRAAQSSGPASRPLLLFYALTQAGRAIVAVRGGTDHLGHGLRLGEIQPDALVTTVGPAATGKLPGHFQSVAGALGTPALSGPAAIGALLASLPEMADTLLMRDEWPPAIALFQREWPQRVPNPGWTPITIDVDQQPLDYAGLIKLLESYPSVRGRIGVPQTIKALDSLPMYPTPEGDGVGVLLQGTDADLDSVAPQYRIAGRRWIRPAIAGGNPPAPTMTWWALLYGLSMYARYHPREWLAALDVDSSPMGVLLERTMDRAIGALPQLVLSDVLIHPFLLPWIEGSGPDPFGGSTR
jgi:hypothetical protein